MKQHSITSVFKKVKVLLEQDKKYQNNDEHLVAKFWWLEMAAMGIAEGVSAKAFFHLYKDGRFTSADVITRARRKVNEEYPHTRGLAYHPRKKNQQAIKDEIRTLDKGAQP